MLICLGTFQTIFSSLVLIFFLIKTAPVFYRRAWYETDSTLQFLWTKKHNNQFYFVIFETLEFLWKVKRLFLFFISDFKVLYYLCYTLLAIMGTWVTKYFTAFLLYDIIWRKPELAHIVRSVWDPKW